MRIQSLLKLCAASVLVIMTTACSKKSTTNYVTAKCEVQNITTTVTATGTIEPVTSVEVGTQVSGIISKIFVDYNSVVKKGQVIAELDKTNLQTELTSALSNLTNAKSNLTYQTDNYKRYKTLFEKGLVSTNDYENARLTYQQALATVHVQEQSVSKARTNLGYATITAPINGVILSREVEEGQTVASAMTTPTLFIIAKDLTDMRVIANVDEADIGNVKEGQRVTFTVDACPDDSFAGTVSQVRQEATTESNVVTYQVVISAPNKDLKLKPGLTANVTIFTQEKPNVLAIPSKALRFTPSDKLLESGQSIKDCAGNNKVWIKDGNVFRAIPVSTGITNGTLTEITSGLKVGQAVLTEISATAADDSENSSDNSNPFMPHPKSSSTKKTSGDSSSGNAAGSSEKSNAGQGGGSPSK